MTRKDRLLKLKAFICTAVYFLVWMESAHALPLFFAVADDSHKAIVTEYRGQIHLTLHHPGNKDKHESYGLSNIPTLVAFGPDKHTDHEISLSGKEQFISPLIKKINATKNILPLLTAQIASVFINTAIIRLSSDSSARTDTRPISSVLLI